MLKAIARRVLSLAKSRTKLLLNPIRCHRLKSSTNIRVHVGCGGDRLPGFTQVDCRPLPSVDVVADLNEPKIFAPGSVSCFYSHAFFEHLYRDSRVLHLKSISGALSPSGFACYIGLPYFPEIARQYLARGPGCISPTFDLFEVYRQTHGQPEMMKGEWIVQLHKSLFDEAEVTDLLRDAGFASWVIFQYAFRSEPISTSCGFYATKEPKADMEASCLEFLKATAADKVNLETVRFLS